MNEEHVVALDPAKFDGLLSAQHAKEFADALSTARRRLAGRTWWHINSTAQGGGVAEMLQSVLCYPSGAGIDTRWLVIDANDGFFDVTKRIHKLLHGEPDSADGFQPLGDEERAVYERPLAPEAAAICRVVRPGDPVILHDPQTLGLAPALTAAGANVVWTCHVGSDEPNDCTRDVWDFLRPYVASTSAQVFSRPQYVWEGLDRSRTAVIPPCLDAFSPKNQPLDADVVDAILATAGIVEKVGIGARPCFVRQDGTEALVTHRAGMVDDTPIPPDARLVCQVSRWDPLKDHAGVMRAFTEKVPAKLGAHLLLAGPNAVAVTDDTEGDRIFEELREQWRALPAATRSRVHLCSLPMDDIDENAAIVNAIQCRSDVVVQKSVAEGFGLTVAEAMWKGRPIVGARVGGIQDQLEDGKSGLLVEPDDDAGFAAAICRLLQDRETAEAIGDTARERVRVEYLAPRFLTRYLELIA